MHRARILLPFVLSLTAGCIEADGSSADAGTTTNSPGTSPSTTTTSSSGKENGSGSVPLPDAGGATTPTGTTSPPAQAADAGEAADASASPGKGYAIDLSETSVSGFSSGAFFAVQFHVAFSSIVKGAAVFAGGPYDCAEDSATAAETTCLSGSPSAATSIASTKQAFASGGIDDPSNLANEKVFLFGGADDSIVSPNVMDALDAYYEGFMASSQIDYVSRHPGTSHTMPTLSYGGSCDSVVAPYVGDCNYDGAGNALAQIYGTLAPKATTLSGQIRSFSQSQFVSNPAAAGLAETGYYYVPASCAGGETCKVHVSFHGCEQNATSVQDAYYGHAGYNEWADTNHIIVLYPQASDSSGNDYDCWDFWGYDGPTYDEKSGTQLAAVRAMITWIASGAAGSSGGGTTSAGSDAGTGLGLSGFDAGECITASNTAQVAAGRATDVGGYAYAKGSNEFLGADSASVQSSLDQVASGYWMACL